MYYLVTTADERTWKRDRPVLFLGEWCRRYHRRHVWSALDAVVASPRGCETSQRIRDVDYVHALADELLTDLAVALNAEHGVERDRRQWKIILGHWLQRYVAVAMNRYRSIAHALSDYKLSGTMALAERPDRLSTNDSLAFVWACDSDAWNHTFYVRALEHLGFNIIDRDRHAVGHGDVAAEEVNGSPPPALRGIRGAVRVAARVLPIFARDRDAVIMNSYLPRGVEIKLQLSLAQCPQLWRSPPIESFPVDAERRKRLRVAPDGRVGFEEFARIHLHEVIPTCYLEGYAALERQARELPWPARPKFVFTSNNFDTDEVFKVWTATQVSRGTRYFTGQHGNNYGTVHGNSCWPERATCDKFLTWGWSDGDPKVVPAFIFKTASRKPRGYSPDGGLVLVEVSAPHRLTTWDGCHEFGQYLAAQFAFANNLPPAIRERLVVRLHAEFAKHQWSEPQRWQDEAPDVRIDLGKESIWPLIAEARLVAHSYDSTGMLETLALDIPTIAFWQRRFDHVIPEAKPFYELLQGAGILFESPQEAASMVAEHWDAIPAWWHSPRVRDARAAFCERYARPEARPVRTVRQLLGQGTVGMQAPARQE